MELFGARLLFGHLCGPFTTEVQTLNIDLLVTSSKR